MLLRSNPTDTVIDVQGTDKHFDAKEAFDCLKSWQFWAFAVCYFCLTNSLNTFGCQSARSHRDVSTRR